MCTSGASMQLPHGWFCWSVRTAHCRPAFMILSVPIDYQGQLMANVWFGGETNVVMREGVTNYGSIILLLCPVEGHLSCFLTKDKNCLTAHNLQPLFCAGVLLQSFYSSIGFQLSISSCPLLVSDLPCCCCVLNDANLADNEGSSISLDVVFLSYNMFLYQMMVYCPLIVSHSHSFACLWEIPCKLII